MSAAVLSAVVGVALRRRDGCARAGLPGPSDAIGTSRVITIDPNDYQRLGTLNIRKRCRSPIMRSC